MGQKIKILKKSYKKQFKKKKHLKYLTNIRSLKSSLRKISA